MKDLIARLEAGSGGDRELDRLIDVRFECDVERTPNYTASFDACIALALRVIPGISWAVGFEAYTKKHHALCGVNGPDYDGHHTDLCRAFLIALLRAREAGDVKG